MDKLLYSYLKKEIDFFFVDFKEQDINSNLFSGNLELQNLRLNVDVLQDLLTPIVPFIQIEKATVHKMKLNVPFTSLTNKPTTVWISRIDIEMKEPAKLHEFQDLMRKKFETKSKQTPKTGKLEYTQFDRVRDGLQLSIDHIHITWSLLGKYRHANPGDWRPHDFHIDLQNLQVYSVDENFNKPEELKETRAYSHDKPYVWHFKEMTCNLSARLAPLPAIYSLDRERRQDPLIQSVPIVSRVPIKIRMTEQRLNANEIVAREFSVILEEMNMEFTPQQFGHLLHWFNALGLAAIREDLKNNKSDKDKTKTIEPIIVKDSVPTMLLNVIVNKMNVALRESQKQPGIEVELTQFQMNRFMHSQKPGEFLTRLLLSQLRVLDGKNKDINLMRFYIRNEERNKVMPLTVPLPKEALIHPKPIPLPDTVRICAQFITKKPAPAPPVPALTYTVNMDSLEFNLERESVETLAIFGLQANIINANRPTPTLQDYQNAAAKEKDDKNTSNVPKDDKDYYEMDLLVNPQQLVQISLQLQEVRVKIPTPGGYTDKAVVEVVVDRVMLEGSPTSQPAVYKKDLLELKSRAGHSLVMDHDFYAQKFISNTENLKDYTLKFNVGVNEVAINIYQKVGAPADPLISIRGLSNYSKIYSMMRYVPDPKKIPQVESSIVASAVEIKLLQRQYLSLLQFLSDQFTYGASSKLKEMLETEIRNLSLTDRPTMKLSEDPNRKKKLLLLPTYMISAACDEITLSLADKNLKEMLHMDIKNVESVLEKHDDRHVVLGRIRDFRLFSLPELEDSIIWVKKDKLPNFFQVRTEWRALRNLDSRTLSVKEKPKSYMLGDMEGLRVNFDIRSIYNMSDYLVDVLAETMILLDKSQHSQYFAKVMKYAEILLVTGLPSEANQYWRNLRELKIWVEQYEDLWTQLVMDFNFNDFKLSLGDEDTRILPLTISELAVFQDTKDQKTVMNVKGVGMQALMTNRENGVLADKPLSPPIGFEWNFTREPRGDWKEGDEGLQYDQHISFTSNPAASLTLVPEHFSIVNAAIQRHVPRVSELITRLMESVEKSDKIFGAGNVLMDEDAVEQARADLAKATSPETIRQLKLQIEDGKKALEEALNVQGEFAMKNADLQLKYIELQEEHEKLKKQMQGYELAMVEMQHRIMELQMKAAGVKK